MIQIRTFTTALHTFIHLEMLRLHEYDRYGLKFNAHVVSRSSPVDIFIKNNDTCKEKQIFDTVNEINYMR